jgi:virginiamycin A acetyltransferase
MYGPDKDTRFPLAHYDRLCFLKNIVKNPHIIVGDYTYYDDFEMWRILKKTSNTILTL